MTEYKRVAIYARVSTTDQTTQNQLLDLQSFSASRGWEIVATFDDSGFSGAKKDRAALVKLMDFVRARRCDCVLVWKYDRFARSLSHLVNTLEEFSQLSVDFVSYRDHIDTTTAQGRMLFGITAVFAEFERDIIRERVHAGLRRARSQGKRLGRPGIPENKTEAIIALRGQASERAIAARVGVSKSVVHRVLVLNPIPNVAYPIDEPHVA